MRSSTNRGKSSGEQTFSKPGFWRRRKKTRDSSKPAFTIVELLVACAVFSLLAAGVLVSALPSLNRFLDRGSTFNVEREIRELKFHLDSLILQATVSRRNFTLIASPVQPTEYFLVKWEDRPEPDKWQMESIAVKPQNTSVYSFVYSHLHQTLTPALTFRIYRREGVGLRASTWSVSVSGYGFVRAHNKYP